MRKDCDGNYRAVVWFLFFLAIFFWVGFAFGNTPPRTTVQEATVTCSYPESTLADIRKTAEQSNIRLVQFDGEDAKSIERTIEEVFGPQWGFKADTILVMYAPSTGAWGIGAVVSGCMEFFSVVNEDVLFVIVKQAIGTYARLEAEKS